MVRFNGINMVETADAVVIGGGVVGLSIAYHLAKEGCPRVVVLEKDLLGSGATGKSVGGIRHQFSTEINVKLSIGSVKMFKAFGEELGSPADLKWVGYLLICSTEKEMETMMANVAMQRRLGVKVELLKGDEVKKLFPQLNCEDIAGATFCSQDGYGDPGQILAGYGKGARALGVKICERREARGIVVSRGRVEAVIAEGGKIATHCVVCAAGPHSALVAAMAGVELPALPYRRQVFVTEPFPEIPGEIPFTIDVHSGFYCRKESGGILMGMADESEPPSFSLDVDWSWLEKVAEAAMGRLPGLERARIMKGWAGLYCISPDHHPIIGGLPGLEGFLCATGFSGHGFMHSPVAGKLIAELIVNGRATTLDIHPLRFSRFAEGDLIEEKNVY